MSILSQLEALTRPGALPALDAPADRRASLGRLGRAALDLTKIGLPFAAATALTTDAQAQGTTPSPVEVFNFALLLEYLEDEFYTQGLDTAGLVTGDRRPVIEQIRKHESAHVAFLTQAITAAGGTPIDKPTFDFTAGGQFRDVFRNLQTFLTLAQAFEDLGVRAYKGQAAFLVGQGDLLTAALQIHSVEARHAAKIRRLRGLDGWIRTNTGIQGVPATDPIYAGEENVTQLMMDASSATLSGGVSAGVVTEAYDEPLTGSQVSTIATLFING